MKDIHGNTLAEAGVVWVVNQAKPLPVADVPMAKGRVVWDEDLLAWVVRYEWVCEAWAGKAGAQMGGGEYAYEKVNGRAA